MLKKILIAPKIHNQFILSSIAADFNLVSFLLSAGFLPIVLPITGDMELNRSTVKTLLHAVDEVSGVILQGGGDIEESLYTKPEQNSDKIRDVFELELVLEASRVNKPILGICRGMQMINVAFGGSLYQDLGEISNRVHLKTNDGSFDYSSFDLSKASVELAHEIYFQKNSLLADVVGNKILVNSIHHQSVQKLGNDLHVEAVADDGVVEIISNWHKNILGVQFHPELDLENQDYKKILNLWLSKI